MNRIRMVGLVLVAMVATGAVAASSAGAALPEVGRCVPAPKAGEYAGKKCTTPAKIAGKGNYNWAPGPGPLPKFSGVGEGVALETVGGKRIECGGETFDGSYTGAKTATVEIDLIGCNMVPENISCQSNPLKEGEIETTLEGELGFIRTGEKPLVGLDLKPKAPSTAWANFECGKLPSVTLGLVEGSAIGLLKPINRMAEEYKLAYKAAGGKQAVQQFEGGPKDTLKTKLVSGLTTTEEESGFRSTIEIQNEEPMEIKAK